MVKQQSGLVEVIGFGIKSVIIVCSGDVVLNVLAKLLTLITNIDVS